MTPEADSHYSTSAPMNVGSTLGIAILALPGEPLRRCLESILDSPDDLVVFTDDNTQARCAVQFGARVQIVDAPTHAETLRQQMQSSLATDWVLILDPDETLEGDSISSFRSIIKTASPKTVGFWVSYHMRFYDKVLSHSFQGLSQMRLFRRNAIRYSGEIHVSPIPLYGNFEHLAHNTPGIIHQFIDSIHERIERHLQWATVEARSDYLAVPAAPDLSSILNEVVGELRKYLLEHEGWKDGGVGVINALLHSSKKLTKGMLLWEMSDRGDFNREDIQEFLSLLQIPYQFHKKL